ncbi:hypothetical protein ACQJ1P_26310, partial [Klebsiella pneumoniae]|uniref:hypothetical protein n=1 Tax=Klebsiella pneumoniae TaxID=573 RepID=UPI003D06021A
TPIADSVAGRMLSLPVSDTLSVADVGSISATFNRILAKEARVPATPRTRPIASLLLVGGGPAGTALLTAAAKRGRLPELAASGLVIA